MAFAAFFTVSLGGLSIGLFFGMVTSFVTRWTQHVRGIPSWGFHFISVFNFAWCLTNYFAIHAFSRPHMFRLSLFYCRVIVFTVDPAGLLEFVVGFFLSSLQLLTNTVVGEKRQMYQMSLFHWWTERCKWRKKVKRT